MDKLRVRTYSVHFGDALLVSVPDRDPGGVVETRHILIDVGNVLLGEGGEDDAFKPVIADIQAVLGGKPLDLYVMTHEHMDHVQGLPYADKYFYPGEDLRQKLHARYAWLTASAAEDYYENHPDAKEKRLALQEAYEAIEGLLWASAEPVPLSIRSLMINNNPRSTKKNVAYLRTLVERPCYVHREFDLGGNHPFHEARLEIWAPEEGTSIYYGRFQPMALGVTPPASGRRKPSLTEVTPPSGVDAGAFYNLLRQRRGYAENLLAIDKAANNTSVVFCLEWRGWRLLFTGDAEDRSWLEMNKADALKPVHFLKVSHHGSHTGLPRPELLDKILPMPPPDDRRRCAVVSTYPDVYKGVPDRDLLKQELTPRCEVKYVEKDTVPDGGHLDVEFEA